MQKKKKCGMWDWEISRKKERSNGEKFKRRMRGRNMRIMRIMRN